MGRLGSLAGVGVSRPRARGKLGDLAGGGVQAQSQGEVGGSGQGSAWVGVQAHARGCQA